MTPERLAELREQTQIETGWRTTDVGMSDLTWLLDAAADRDKLQAFKTWTHDYLDAHGVPHHPPGTHGAEGCRIGDRMDWLMAEQDRLRSALAQHTLAEMTGIPKEDIAQLALQSSLEASDELAAENARLRERVRAMEEAAKEALERECTDDDGDPITAQEACYCTDTGTEYGVLQCLPCRLASLLEKPHGG